MTSPRFFRVALPALAAALAACADAPTAVRPEPAVPVEVARLACTAHVRARTLSCEALGATGGGASGVVVPGPNGEFVFLSGTNVSFLSGDNVWSADVTVQNLIPQPLGTSDGASLDSAGVRVFFIQPPTAVTGDSGAISILNESGTDAFTASGQAYYQYDEILATNQTSQPFTWEFGVDPAVETFAFVVAVAAQVPRPNGYVDVTPPADTLAEGGVDTLTAVVRNALGVAVGGSVTWETSDSSVAVVGATGIVSALAPGTATITASSGLRSGSATIVVCPALALGEVHVADLPAGASVCLGGGAAGAEYVAVPVNLADSVLALSVTGAGIVSVSGPPSPDRVPLGGPRLARSGLGKAGVNGTWERALRLRERRELGPKMAAARAALREVARGRRAPSGAARAITPGVPAVGALMTLNAESGFTCSNPDLRTGRVMAVGTRIIVMADTMNPSGGLTAADYQAIADSFDAVVHPAVTAGFDDPSTGAAEGTPADIDGNGRVIAFYTRAVNELTPPGSSAFVGGFFFSRDLFPASECAASNVGEMFYMLAADPAGTVNGNARSAAFVLETTLGTLAHELQHMVNASRRLYVNAAPGFEDVWLGEGLSHVAEELVFYQAAGLAPLADLGVTAIGDGGQREAAFFKYQEANFGRLRRWLLAPDSSGLFQDDDDLATRGAAWAFLRYAADREGGTQPAFWSALLNSTTAGMANVQAVLGTDPLPWARDFAAAMYADDAGIGENAPYTMPSWDFRSLYAALDYTPGPACSCAYELAARDPANGVAETFTLAGGGAAAYVRMGVPAGAFAGLAVTRPGGAAPPAPSQIASIRRKEGRGRHGRIRSGPPGDFGRAASRRWGRARNSFFYKHLT